MPVGATAERLAAAAAAHRAGSSWREIAQWYGWRSARAAEEEVRVRLAPQDWQRRRGALSGPPARPAWRTVRLRAGVYAGVHTRAARIGVSLAACVEEALLHWLDDGVPRAADLTSTGAVTPRTRKTAPRPGDDVYLSRTLELARGTNSEEGEDGA